ncbi:2TM domain-containing protein [Flavobacterium sp. XN-5]|uniref:2TM domain-containing protein n=1 Tax=Flavobacterium sp. XN-5 TaxID=2599390 RepID=UPI0011CA61B0|nr:2TM domain-containing protein [Flavobacterium sp. XN-5]NGY38344.1 2TM domain-containing protein [Flavobacterium sp. XN-5]
MGRFRKRMDGSYQPEDNSSDERYNLAYKRVKRIKGFYIHALVYVLVNTFILLSISNSSRVGDAVFWEWQTWNTVFFWGIGLVAHGLSVFGKNIFFGTNWEQKKIQEFMDKDKENKWE